MTFLPATRPQAVRSTGGAYFKPQDGDNKVRILSDAVIGYVYWTNDNKPVRTREYPALTPNIKERNGKADRPKLFWAMLVWNYATNQVETWEVTQRSIQDAIEAYADDEEWGHPNQYDLKISKSGKELDTTYAVIASPAKPAPKEAIEAYESSGISLDSIFSDAPALVAAQLQVNAASKINHPDWQKFEDLVTRAKDEAQLQQAIAWVYQPERFTAISAVAGERFAEEVEKLENRRKQEFQLDTIPF